MMLHSHTAWGRVYVGDGIGWGMGLGTLIYAPCFGIHRYIVYQSILELFTVLD